MPSTTPPAIPAAVSQKGLLDGRSTISTWSKPGGRDPQKALPFAMSADTDADTTEGSESTYLQVSVSSSRPGCLTISTRWRFPLAREQRSAPRVSTRLRCRMTGQRRRQIAFLVKQLEFTLQINAFRLLGHDQVIVEHFHVCIGTPGSRLATTPVSDSRLPKYDRLRSR